MAGGRAGRATLYLIPQEATMIQRIAVVTLLALAACAPKPETPDQAAARMKAEADTARTAIAAANAAMSKYLAANQMDSAAMLYAEDAVFYPANMPAVRGRPAIAALFKSWGAAGAWTVAPSTYSVEANGPLAIETGRGLMTYAPGPNAPATMKAAFTDTMKYVTTWRKVGGKWLISNDISTTDRAAQPAPAKKRR